MNETLLKAVIQKSQHIDLVSTDCWLWTGYHDEKGYGQLIYRGKNYKAHRWFWQIVEGDVPTGLELDHLCRNRACVRPDHLEPVTHLENVGRGLNAKKPICKYGHRKDTRVSNGKPRLECFVCRKEYNKRRYALRKEQV